MADEYKSFTYDLLEELGEEHRLGCKCCRFYKGIDLPIPRKLDIDQTREAARGLSTGVLKDWVELNAIMKRFEGTIQKRWMKKNIRHRRELLLKAWPEICHGHRPDFLHFRHNRKQEPRSRTCRSAAYLWPYINLEDLQQRHFLLLFLNARARNMPSEFRIADVKTAHLGEGWAPQHDSTAPNASSYCCGQHYLEDHACVDHGMLFELTHSPSGYGKVLDHVAIQMLRRSQMRYMSRSQEGLLALEIQKGIYKFLLSCAKLILHDTESANMLFLAPHQPEPIMPCPNNPDQWASVTGHALEAPYRVPQQLDLEHLKVLAGARRSSAEDHIWMLREDPGYFVDTIREWNEHNGSKCNKMCWCQKCHSREAGRLIFSALSSFLLWDKIFRGLANMDPINVQLQRAEEETSCLSAKDERKWTILTGLLEIQKGSSMQLLEEGIPNSPRLRNKCERYGSPKNVRWTLKPGSGEAANRVYRLFDTILRDDERALHDLQGLVQEVQHMLDTDAEASQYVDSWIAMHFSDIALASEIMTSIGALAPWFDQSKAHMVLEAGNRDVEKTLTLLGTLRLEVKNACTHCDWDVLKQGKLDYPADKRPSKANTEQMRIAEQYLDMFWWTLEIEVSEAGGVKLEDVLEAHMLHPRGLHRTAPWKEPPQLPTPLSTPKKPLADTDHDVGQFYNDPVKKPDIIPPKYKLKTRGAAAALDPRVHAYRNGEPLILEEVLAKEKIKVPKKVYEVISALLPTTNSAMHQRREVAWDELVYTMDAIGLEPEKLYGSVWIFKPRPKGDPRRLIDLPRSVQFHEPKGLRRGQKIASPMVRTLGRQLRHAFGWQNADDMFEIE